MHNCRNCFQHLFWVVLLLLAAEPASVRAQDNVEFLLSGKTINCFEREKERYFEVIVGNEYFYIAPQSCPDDGSEGVDDIGVSINLNDIIVAESIGGVSLTETNAPAEHILIYLNRLQFDCAISLAVSESIEDEKLYAFDPKDCSIGLAG